MKLNIGDTIACEVQHPLPATLKATLKTQEAVVFGLELIGGGNWYKLTNQKKAKTIAIT